MRKAILEQEVKNYDHNRSYFKNENVRISWLKKFLNTDVVKHYPPDREIFFSEFTQYIRNASIGSDEAKANENLFDAKYMESGKKSVLLFQQFKKIDADLLPSAPGGPGFLVGERGEAEKIEKKEEKKPIRLPAASPSSVASGLSFFSSARFAAARMEPPVDEFQSYSAGFVTTDTQRQEKKEEKQCAPIDVKSIFNLSLEKLETLAVLDNPDAQLLLGQAYLYGSGTRKNKVKAEEWLCLAAKHTDLPAGQCALALMYNEGVGRRKEWTSEKAFINYRAAADSGYAPAQCLFGMDCYSLRRVAWSMEWCKDEEEGMRLLRLAAEQGYAYAQNNLGTKLKDNVEALRLYRLAASHGGPQAQVNIGNYYKHGVGGVTKNLKEALRWYQLAADQEFAEGEYQLANCYAKGIGCYKNPDRALLYYESAEKQGQHNARAGIEVLEYHAREAARSYCLVM